MMWRIKDFYRRKSEKLLLAFVWILPRKLVYWCAVRVIVYNYNGNPSERSIIDVMKGWEDVPLVLSDQKL
jgi:hypothetical protein